eukprot:6661317-Heterocapsa_arctica.AAC.1
MSLPDAQGGSSSSYIWHGTLDCLDALVTARSDLTKPLAEYEWAPTEEDYATIADETDQDWQCMQFNLRRGKMGRAAPPLSSPREVWAIALRAHAWCDLLYSVLWLIRAVHRTSLLWNISLGVPIPKHNHKE